VVLELFFIWSSSRLLGAHLSLPSQAEGLYTAPVKAVVYFGLAGCGELHGGLRNEVLGKNYRSAFFFSV